MSENSEFKYFITRMRIFKDGVVVMEYGIPQGTIDRKSWLLNLEDYDYYELDDRMRVMKGFEESENKDYSLVTYLK